MVYRATIISLQEEKTFNIGQQAYFDCNLIPELGESVSLRYRWNINNQFISSRKNTSINIEFDYTKLNVLYCEISANNFVLGKDHFILEVEGKN